MKTVLISLVSEQTIPNVLLIKEFNEIVTDYVFITTEKMERENRTDCIIKAANIDSAKSKRIQVNQDSIEDIEQELQANLPATDEDNTYIVNLTGGNKLMFLAAYNFVTKKNCTVYYFPVQDKMTRYESIYPQKSDHELDCRLTLQEYLDAYGIRPTSKTFNKLVKTPEATQNFFKHYLTLSSDDLGVLDALRSKNYRGKKVTLSAIQEDEKLNSLEDLLRRLDFEPKSSGKLDKDETKYLTGDWFEEYFYHQLKQHFDFAEDVIGTGVHVGFDESQNDTSNECDVLFVCYNRLYLVECKTSIYDEKTRRSIFSETAYKAAALRKKFGLNVKSIICTLSERGNDKNTIRDSDMKRAKVFEIEYIWDRDIITDPHQLAQKLNAL